MRLLDRIITAVERYKLSAERRTIYRNDLDLVAAGRLAVINYRLVELGGKSYPCLPYIGEESGPIVKRAVIEDDCGVPEGLVGEWRAPA